MENYGVFFLPNDAYLLNDRSIISHYFETKHQLNLWVLFWFLFFCTSVFYSYFNQIYQICLLLVLVTPMQSNKNTIQWSLLRIFYFHLQLFSNLFCAFVSWHVGCNFEAIHGVFNHLVNCILFLAKCVFAFSCYFVLLFLFLCYCKKLKRCIKSCHMHSEHKICREWSRKEQDKLSAK